MAKDTTKSKDKKKKRGGPGKWFKEMGSELKKVSWPSFATTMKQLGAVLAVTIFFLLVLMGMDAILMFLYKLLVKGLEAGTASMLINAFSANNILSVVSLL